MALGFDDLIERLLYDVALSGNQGTSTDELRRAINAFYSSQYQNSDASRAESSEIDQLFSTAPPASEPAVDEKLIDRVWDWLVARPDIFVRVEQPDGLLVDGAAPSTTDEPDSVDTTKRRIFTTEERIWQAITGHGVDHKRVPRFEFDCLSIIAGYGPNGVLQPEVTRLTGQDKRSVPARTNALAQKGYIAKEDVLGLSTKTSLLKLKKYAQDASLAQKDRATAVPADDAQNSKAKDVIHYDEWFENVIKMLKGNNNIMTMDDIRSGLGIESKSWQVRALTRCIRRLAKDGCVRRLKARRADMKSTTRGTKEWPKCLRLEREPTANDRITFRKGDSAFKKRAAAGEDAVDGRNNVQDADADADADRDEDDYEDDDPDDLDLLDNPPISQWTPDLPYTNLVHNLVHEAGVSGISSMDLAVKAMGPLWRRPLDDVMGRLTDIWQTSQPSHLKHLGIVRDTGVKNRFSYFQYRSRPNFEQAVEAGATSWEAIEDVANVHGRHKHGKQRKHKTPEPQDTELDEWGFPRVSPRLFAGCDGRASLADCRGNTDAYRPHYVRAEDVEGNLDSAFSTAKKSAGKRRYVRREARRPPAPNTAKKYFERKRVSEGPEREGFVKRAKLLAEKIVMAEVEHGRIRKASEAELDRPASLTNAISSEDGLVAQRTPSIPSNPYASAARSGGQPAECGTPNGTPSSSGQPTAQSPNASSPILPKKDGRPSKAMTPKRLAKRKSQRPLRQQKKSLMVRLRIPLQDGSHALLGAFNSFDSTDLTASTSDEEESVPRPQKRRRMSSTTPAQSRPPTTLPDLPAERIAEVEAEILARTRQGVYIDPPGSRALKAASYVQSGRPRNATIAVFKLERLHDLPWFEKQGPRVAPKASLRRTDFVLGIGNGIRGRPQKSSSVVDSDSELDDPASPAARPASDAVVVGNPVPTIGKALETIETLPRISRAASRSPTRGSLPNIRSPCTIDLPTDQNTRAVESPLAVDDAAIEDVPAQAKTDDPPAAHAEVPFFDLPPGITPTAPAPAPMVFEGRNRFPSKLGNFSKAYKDLHPEYEWEHRGKGWYYRVGPAAGTTVTEEVAAGVALRRGTADERIIEGDATTAATAPPSAVPNDAEATAPVTSTPYVARKSFSIPNELGNYPRIFVDQHPEFQWEHRGFGWFRKVDHGESAASNSEGAVAGVGPDDGQKAKNESIGSGDIPASARKNAETLLTVPTALDALGVSLGAPNKKGYYSKAIKDQHPEFLWEHRGAGWYRRLGSGKGTANATAGVGNGVMQSPRNLETHAADATNREASTQSANGEAPPPAVTPPGALDDSLGVPNKKGLYSKQVKERHPEFVWEHHGFGQYRKLAPGHTPVHAGWKRRLSSTATDRVSKPVGEVAQAGTVASAPFSEDTANKTPRTASGESPAEISTAIRNLGQDKTSLGDVPPVEGIAPVLVAPPVLLTSLAYDVVQVKAAPLAQPDIPAQDALPTQNTSSAQDAAPIQDAPSPQIAPANGNPPSTQVDPARRAVGVPMESASPSRPTDSATATANGAARNIGRVPRTPFGTPMLGTRKLVGPGQASHTRKGGPTRSGGAVKFQRTKLIMDAVQACGGAFPGDHELQYPFETGWRKLNHKTNPDKTTVHKVVKGLLGGGRLQKITFQFKAKNGKIVEKHLLTEPDKHIGSPVVMDMIRKIQEVYPKTYIPEQADVSDEVQARMDAPHSMAPKARQIHKNFNSEEASIKQRTAVDAFPRDASAIVRRIPGLTKSGASHDRLKQAALERLRQRGASGRGRGRGGRYSKIADRAQFLPEALGIEEEEYIDPEQAVMQSTFQLNLYQHEPKSAVIDRGVSGRKRLGRLIRFDGDKPISLPPAFDIAEPNRTTEAGHDAPRCGQPQDRLTNTYNADQRPGTPLGSGSTLLSQSITKAQIRQILVPSKSRSRVIRPSATLQPMPLYHVQTFLETSGIFSSILVPEYERFGISTPFTSSLPPISQPQTPADPVERFYIDVQAEEPLETECAATSASKWIHYDFPGIHVRPADEYLSPIGNPRKPRFRAPGIGMFDRDINDRLVADWPHLRPRPSPHIPFDATSQEPSDLASAALISEQYDNLMPTMQYPHSNSTYTHLQQSKSQAPALVPSEVAGVSPWLPLSMVSTEVGSPTPRILIPLSQPPEVRIERPRGGVTPGLERRAPATLPGLTGSSTKERRNFTRRVIASRVFVDVDRLLLAITVVKTLTDGVNSSNLNWPLIAQAMNLQTTEHIKKRWGSLKTTHNATVARLQDEFRDVFLQAYEKGEVPTVDYGNIENTDLSKIVGWAAKNLVLSQQRAEKLDIPASREDLQRQYSGLKPGDLREPSRENFYRPSALMVSKNETMHEILYSNIVLGMGKDEADKNLMLAKSWVRAVAAMGTTAFADHASYHKLTIIPPQTLQMAIDDLLVSRVIKQDKSGRQQPGRNFYLDDMFTHTFRHNNWDAAYLIKTAAAKAQIDAHFEENDVMELSFHASDAEITVLTNLVAAGRIKIKTTLPPIKNGLDAPFPKLSKWGSTALGYPSRALPRDAFRFKVEYHKTSTYLNGVPLNKCEPPALAPPVPGEPGQRTPYWVNIHGTVMPGFWHVVLQSMLYFLVYRPGSTAKAISTAHRGQFWMWEIELFLQWAEEAGLAKKMDLGGCVDKGGKSAGDIGWMATEWWYLAFAPEARTQCESRRQDSVLHRGKRT